MRRLVTIGVYGWSQQGFLTALRESDVRLLLDVRQRRGVRGPLYTWANAQRLETAMRDAGIEYRHLPGLAPTKELRELQYREDDRLGVRKRSRQELAAEYVDRYTREILDRVDLESVLELMPDEAASALCCVERDPEACHRSLIANRMADRFGIAVNHLLPEY